MPQDKYDNNRGKGFTLVETLVALAVLSVSMTPVFALVTSSFRLSRNIRENLTAAMLAQEGVELVRGIRDDNWFNPSAPPFDESLFPECSSGCHIQHDDDVPRPGAGVPLKIDDQGRFGYGGGRETPFSRLITITQVDVAHIQVQCTVTWESDGEPRTVAIQDDLFDWLNP